MAVAENPYRTNGIFVGRAAEMAAIRSHLAAGQSTLLIGGRRAGKTFLASRVADVGRPVVVIDAGAWALDSESTVLNEIGTAVDRAVGSLAIDGQYTRESLTERLRQAGRIAIMIDEADRILAEPWAGSFLSYLRWMDDSALRSLIAFVLIGGPSLVEYRNPDDHGSPPLNTADPVFIEPLSAHDVGEMAACVAGQVRVSKVMRWAGGHPWLINRLLCEIWDGKNFQTAIDHLWDVSLRNFKVWYHQIGEKGATFLRVLPNRGCSISQFHTGRMARHREALLRCRYTCLVRRGERGAYQPGPKLFMDWLDSATGEAHSWDLAISYASEDLDLARSIHEQLSGDYKVFFAPAEVAYLWGHDLNKALPHTYGVDSRFVLVISSEHYVKKYWTRVEFDAAMKSLGPGRLMVLKLDVLPPDMPPDIVVVDASHANLVRLIENIKRKISKSV